MKISPPQDQILGGKDKNMQNPLREAAVGGEKVEMINFTMGKGESAAELKKNLSTARCFH